LAELRRQWPEFYTHHLQVWNWATVAEADAVFIQRPWSNDHVGMMQMALDVDVPVWIDYDDLLWEMPTDNPSFFLYSSQGKLQNMSWCIKNASHVTVSTPELKRQLEKLNKNVTVIPNAIDMRYFKYRAEPPPRTKKITWRGSRTHHRDVLEVCQTLQAAHMKHKDFEWHFMGDNLWFITDNFEHKRTIVREPVEWCDYFRHIWGLAPTAMIAPLSESPFNLSKSNIAWIEGAFAGAVTIAPDFEEWRKPGVLTYKNETELGLALEAVLSGGLPIAAAAKSAWDYIQENLTLAKVNKIRKEVLSSLI
jgi:hypothetical protein